MLFFGEIVFIKHIDMRLKHFIRELRIRNKRTIGVVRGIEGDYSTKYELKSDNPHEKMYHNSIFI